MKNCVTLVLRMCPILFFFDSWSPIVNFFDLCNINNKHPIKALTLFECVNNILSQASSGGKYTWRIDLRRTECHWSGWFSGLSSLFLSCHAQKLLLLASLDRLDTDLTVAQMQGDFYC